MRGGALTRYKTPHAPQAGSGLHRYPELVQVGRGFAEDLVRVAGPTLLQAGSDVLRNVGEGMNLGDAVSHSGNTLKKRMIRRAPGMGAVLAGKAVKRKAVDAYKGTAKRFRDIFD